MSEEVSKTPEKLTVETAGLALATFAMCSQLLIRLQETGLLLPGEIREISQRAEALLARYEDRLDPEAFAFAIDALRIHYRPPEATPPVPE